MKNLFRYSCILLILSSAIIFTSCTENSPVAPQTEAAVQWQAVDSIPDESIDRSFIVSENEAYFTNTYGAYRIHNGIRTKVDFQDANFFCSNGDAYSANYVVFAGVTNGSRSTLKIFNGGTISTVIPDNTINTYLSCVKIIQPGKILASTNYKLYLYDNGTVTTYTISPDEDIYNLVVSNNGSIFISAFAGEYHDKIYRLDNDSLTLIETEETLYRKFQSNNNLFRNIKNSLYTSLSYFTGLGWNFIGSDSASQKFIYGAGSDMSYDYFITVDSVSGKMRGSWWTGSLFKRDSDFPLSSQNMYYTSISNMRDNTFYFTKYMMSSNKTYVYKVKRTT
ncbi:MAG: hypothetical protein J0M18_18320 [Ignavibacteria bacterium]|nr:hypothetical protein [Ignavibacteria bacterium]